LSTNERGETVEMELKRAMAPEEVGAREECGVCAVEFTTEVVSVHVLHHDLGVVCRECVGYLGRRNPSRFPTIAEYEEANRLYTEPVYKSEQEILALEDVDDPSVHEAYRDSWISRASR
jgi:hypothetical protein